MIVRLKFRFQAPRTAAETRESRFRELIRAASQTPYYEPYIMSGAGWTESEIRDLPAVEFTDVKVQPQRFWNPASQHAPRRYELFYPFPHPQRTAVLSAGFPETESLHCYPNGWSPRMNEYEPEVLAGSVHKLRTLAVAVLTKNVRLAPVRRAVLAFEGFDQRALTQADRDLFWRAFGVPTFAQFLVQGETLASECEAHDGLHRFEERGIFEFRERAGAGRELMVSSLRPLPYTVLRWSTGMVAEMAESRCGCGAHQPRIMAVPGVVAAPSTAAVVGGGSFPDARRRHEKVLTMQVARARVAAAAAGDGAGAGAAAAGR
jgi:hypothetical protein